MSRPAPAISFFIEGPPKTKENKGAFGRAGWYNKKHEDIVNWEVGVNWQAIDVMKEAGFTGPYTGRCAITVGQTFECWKRCDITNYWKSLNDALNGAVWVDDSQVDEANAVRFINREDPGILVMIWFYDFDYEEQFWTGKTTSRFNKKSGERLTSKTMRYPSTYGIFELSGFEYKPTVAYISKPDDAPATRYGTFEKLKSLEERERDRKAKKGTTGKKKTAKKSRRKRTAPNDQVKPAAVAKPKRRGTGGSGVKGTVRKRTSS